MRMGGCCIRDTESIPKAFGTFYPGDLSLELRKFFIASGLCCLIVISLQELYLLRQHISVTVVLHFASATAILNVQLVYRHYPVE